LLLNVIVKGRSKHYSKSISNGNISQRKKYLSWLVDVPAGIYYLKFSYGSNNIQSDDFSVVEKQGNDPYPNPDYEPDNNRGSESAMEGSNSGIGSKCCGSKNGHSDSIGNTIVTVISLLTLLVVVFGVYRLVLREFRV
jgi:hypothetical protein